MSYTKPKIFKQSGVYILDELNPDAPNNEQYMVLMIVKHPSGEAERDYLQPAKYADGAPMRFTLDQANEWIDRKVNRPSEVGATVYVDGLCVLIDGMDHEEVQDLSKRLWGVRPTDLALLADAIGAPLSNYPVGFYRSNS
jgi:hypothetical protein